MPKIERVGDLPDEGEGQKREDAPVNPAGRRADEEQRAQARSCGGVAGEYSMRAESEDAERKQRDADEGQQIWEPATGGAEACPSSVLIDGQQHAEKQFPGAEGK